MRNILILFVCCAWLVSACGKNSQVEHGQAASSIEFRKEKQRAADEASTQAFREKEEFRRRAEKTLEGYQRQIDKL
ncbi:MAG TPA: hypothetical protein VE131_13820, partial [Terriglobales bacterium]|nr:hypothetical protein [Terriglobales bacterium]